MTLFVAAVAMAIIGMLAYIVRRQYYSSVSDGIYRKHQAQEIAHLRRQLSSVGEVVARSGGGLDKRISEHTEIVSAIQSRSPALLQEEPGLQHWLAANSEFFASLRAALPAHN